MRNPLHDTRTLLASLLLLASPLPLANAQVVKLPRPSVIQPYLSTGTITVMATPALVSFTLVHGGAASGSSGISITTAASGLTLLSTISMYGYFSSTSALTDTQGDILPASDVFGLCTTGSPTTYTAFTQSSTFATGSSLLIWQMSSLLSLGSGRTDVLQLKIDLASSPQQPAGVYSGTLTLQVAAF